MQLRGWHVQSAQQGCGNVALSSLAVTVSLIYRCRHFLISSLLFGAKVNRELCLSAILF
jgi:hypothetical protein